MVTFAVSESDDDVSVICAGVVKERCRLLVSQQT